MYYSDTLTYKKMCVSVIAFEGFSFSVLFFYRKDAYQAWGIETDSMCPADK